MGRVKVTLIKSKIGSESRVKKTLQALGLNKISSHAEHEANAQINGMIRKVIHLVKVEEVK